MSLPPVVSNPEVCWAQDTQVGSEYPPHDWLRRWNGLEICRYCGGRKP